MQKISSALHKAFKLNKKEKEKKEINKRQQAIYEAWKRSNARILSDVYKSYSNAKAYAYSACRMMCSEEFGYSFKIISKNTFMFTVGYIFENEKDEIYFHYISPTNDEIFKISDNKEHRPIWEFC